MPPSSAPWPARRPTRTEARVLLLHNRGLIALVHDLGAAARWFEQAKAAAGVDPMWSAIVELRLAKVAMLRGLPDDVVARLGPGREPQDALPITRVMQTGVLVEALIARGDAQEALRVAEHAHAAGESGLAAVQITSHDTLAKARLGVGDAPGAEAAAAAAIAAADQAAEYDHRRFALLSLGRARHRQGDLAGAEAAYTEALQLFSEDPTWARLECDLAEVQEASGDPTAAWDRRIGALRTAVARERGMAAAVVCCRLADAAAARGRFELAAILLGAAEGLRDRAGIVVGEVGCRGELADAALAALDTHEVATLAAQRAAGRSMDLEAVLAAVTEHQAP